MIKMIALMLQVLAMALHFKKFKSLTGSLLSCPLLPTDYSSLNHSKG